MKSDLKIKLVDFNNIKEAITIQNEIFPDENGTLNLLASVDRTLFIKITNIHYIDDDVKYYLVYKGIIPIGITGLYCYRNEYPDDAWIAFFGVRKKYRSKGFAKRILNWTVNQAEDKGFKSIRLYTDPDVNNTAVKLYEKMGFTGEKYSAEKLDYNCWIYSKSLNDQKVSSWNNKFLGLTHQSSLDHFDKEQIAEILDKYKDIIKNSSN